MARRVAGDPVRRHVNGQRHGLLRGPIRRVQQGGHGGSRRGRVGADQQHDRLVELRRRADSRRQPHAYEQHVPEQRRGCGEDGRGLQSGRPGRNGVKQRHQRPAGRQRHAGRRRILGRPGHRLRAHRRHHRARGQDTDARAGTDRQVRLLPVRPGHRRHADRWRHVGGADRLYRIGR